VIRVWSAGCSTGEEAYSLAMLLTEKQAALNESFKMQVFATDIDSQSIAIARAGQYPASIAPDLSSERLAFFFTALAGVSEYKINKGIRDVMVFSVHNLIKDPPFSKLDLISCRNLLIYLNSDLQKKLIPLLYSALNPGGYLFLGPSESIAGFDDLFIAVDREAKLYRRKDNYQDERHINLSKLLPPDTLKGIAANTRTNRDADVVDKITLREITEQELLKQVASSAVLVNAKGSILFLHGRTGMYLEPAPGEFDRNILKMAREGLRSALTNALYNAIRKNKIIRSPGLSVKTNGSFSMVNLTILPVEKESAAIHGELLYLIILEEAPIVNSEQAQHTTADAGSNFQIQALNEELRTKDEYLQTAIEELQSTNEELQSTNEELQSANEELETSQEELQSLNEELITVNSELQTKVVDLSRIINDMNNLLGGTNIATIFVDHHLRILRFTPSATRIINLILADVGRPVNHILSNLVVYDRLAADVQIVLDSLIPKEVEVQTIDGKWFTLNIQPYRTVDNVIEGAVITFMDITENVISREKLKHANEQLRLIPFVRNTHDAISVLDLEGRIIAWNPGAVRMYGWSEAEALKMNEHDRIPEKLRSKALAMYQQLSQAEILKPCRTQRITKDGAIVNVTIISTALVDEAGHMFAIATIERKYNPKDDRKQEG